LCTTFVPNMFRSSKIFEAFRLTGAQKRMWALMQSGHYCCCLILTKIAMYGQTSVKLSSFRFHAYLLSRLVVYGQTDGRTYTTRTRMHADTSHIHTYKHSYVRTYIHTYIHTHRQTDRHSETVTSCCRHLRIWE